MRNNNFVANPGERTDNLDIESVLWGTPATIEC